MNAIQISSMRPSLEERDNALHSLKQNKFLCVNIFQHPRDDLPTIKVFFSPDTGIINKLYIVCFRMK